MRAFTLLVAFAIVALAVALPVQKSSRAMRSTSSKRTVEELIGDAQTQKRQNDFKWQDKRMIEEILKSLQSELAKRSMTHAKQQKAVRPATQKRMIEDIIKDAQSQKRQESAEGFKWQDKRSSSKAVRPATQKRMIEEIIKDVQSQKRQVSAEGFKWQDKRSPQPLANLNRVDAMRKAVGLPVYDTAVKRASLKHQERRNAAVLNIFKALGMANYA